MRLIDADALKNEVDTWGCNDYDKHDFIEAIDNAPTVETTKVQSYCMGFADGLAAQNYEKPPMFERPQGDIFPMKIVAGKCPIEAGGNCPLRPKGEWIVDGCLIACNKCGRILLKASELYNFCPNCGADMRKENDNGKS